MKSPLPTCEPTRYFTDEYNVWKFASGESPQHRNKEDATWDQSGFSSLKDFQASPGDVTEITAEEGEV